MDFWHSLNGLLELELTCADPALAISQLHSAGVDLRGVQSVDAFTIRLSILRQQYRKVQSLCRRRGYEIRLTGERGLYWRFKGLLRRPVLVIGLLILFGIGMFLPTRILFFRVEGNISVPTRLILEEAAGCGIRFGASRREVRSEKMKNALLEAMPQLQWAGINTSGCVATITVRERPISETTENLPGVSSIVALRDGVITEITSTKGNTICKVGQAVKAGQTLISGYTDCGISIRATRAEGEVYAKTERTLAAVTPLKYSEKREIQRVEKKYSVIIGKKRINFYKGSGISDATCDKMYSESYVTLPGGFRLPVILVTEVWTYYESGDVTLEPDEEDLSRFAEQYLAGQMTAGQILSRAENIDTNEELCSIQGKYSCLEMIGQVRNEEIIGPDGNYD